MASARMGPLRPVGGRKEVAGSRRGRMGKAGLTAIPTGPFAATGHRSGALSLGALGQQGGKAIRPAQGSRGRRAGSRVGAGLGVVQHLWGGAGAHGRTATHTQKPQMCTPSHTHRHT